MWDYVMRLHGGPYDGLEVTTQSRQAYLQVGTAVYRAGDTLLVVPGESAHVVGAVFDYWRDEPAFTWEESR